MQPRSRKSQLKHWWTRNRSFHLEMCGVQYREGQCLPASPGIWGTFATETKIDASLLYFVNIKLQGVFIGEGDDYLFCFTRLIPGYKWTHLAIQICFVVLPPATVCSMMTIF